MEEKMEEKNDIIKQRYINLESMQEKGVFPFKNNYSDIKNIAYLKENYQEGIEVKIAGRIMAKREHGKSVFLDVKDFSGKIQLYMHKDVLDEQQFVLLKSLDIGDIIGAKGGLFKTRTGEETIKVDSYKILSKSLLPLPEKWHGLKDVETKYRQRYVDLIINDTVKDVFVKRTKIINNVRKVLENKGFLEVETPMMHPIAGGAAGKPFKTHHEALDMDLFMRIAPELYLKRLLVGGFEKVFEINRSFRNEGISTRHNPEFTMLEVYEAYSDCNGMMKLVEEIICTVAENIFGTKKFMYQEKEIDFSVWEKVSFADLMLENFGISPKDSLDVWLEKLKQKNINIEGNKVSKTQIINIVGELVEPKAGNHPVFVVDMFKELSPLAKEKKDMPGIADRFELYIGGMEVANAYSELNDPIDQKKRFMEQVKADKDASMDEDFIKALEYGMPPAGGLGIGIDRLVMILTNSVNIRDVILFPHMRAK